MDNQFTNGPQESDGNVQYTVRLHSTGLCIFATHPPHSFHACVCVCVCVCVCSRLEQAAAVSMVPYNDSVTAISISNNLVNGKPAGEPMHHYLILGPWLMLLQPSLWLSLSPRPPSAQTKPRC